jgi:hypothetical protein
MTQWNQANPGNVIDGARAAKLYGRGGYWGSMIGGALGGLTGNARMKSWGASLGDQFGDAVGAYIPGGNMMAAGAEAAHRAYLQGSGGYSMDGDMTPSPQVGSFAQGEVDSIRIRKREYLGAILGSAGIAIKSLVINAGDPATFPSLSRVAMNYEQYKMNGCVFWFKSTSGESSSVGDTAIGEIIMASQSDSAEVAPTNKQQLVSTDGSVQNKPSLSSCYGVECADVSVLKIRHGDPNERIEAASLYDVGRFFIATEGMNAATTRVGELWVTYDCTLIRSRDPRGLETLGFRGNWPNALQTNLFSTTTPNILVNNLRLTFQNNTISFPQFINDGTYVVIVKAIGVPMTPGGRIVQFGALITSVAHLTIIAEYVDRVVMAGPLAGTASEGVTHCQYVVRINAPENNVAAFVLNNDMNWQTALGGALNGYLEVEAYRVPDAAYP